MASWRPDALLPGFESLELGFPDDYDGAVVATLVRLPAGDAPRGAVLYVHGYTDYFFQRHMAERFAMEGYAFHALDLRKYGRSLRAHQHPNFCKNVAEYYADLSKAIAVIGAPVLLAGHSTGGLVCALYAHEGERCDQVSGLWLNSPFFDWRAPDWKRPQKSSSQARLKLDDHWSKKFSPTPNRLYEPLAVCNCGKKLPLAMPSCARAAMMR